MRRRQIVASCLVVGSLVAAAIAPGVMAGRHKPKVTVPAGFTIDRQVTDSRGSVYTEAHKFRVIRPGEKGYVPEPKPGQKGYEAPR